MRLALVLEYDGTAFAGFQIQPQPGRRTVQGTVQAALERLAGSAIPVAGAGRTDTGVHARGQVVAFDAPGHLPVRTYASGLNRFLPDDVAVMLAREVAADFDPRRHARDRWYRYTLVQRPGRSPLVRTQALVVPSTLNLAGMADALGHLVGTHDFAAFTTPGADAPASTVRCLRTARLTATGDHVVIDLVGTAFLPQQVRRTVAALLLVGNRRRPPSWFGELVQDHRPGAAGPGVLPQGLCLMAVRYFPPYDDMLPPLDSAALHGVPLPGYLEGDDDAGDHPEDLHAERGGPAPQLACD
jgi:tRNA pseudouridine38-40 synthase